jgi:hypothetical protein
VSWCLRPYTFSPGTSSWVSTATTPGNASAGATSSRVIRAYGCGLRNVAPHNMFSCQRSDANANSPRTFSVPSGRSGLSPMPPEMVSVRRCGERAGALTVLPSSAVRPAGPRP